MNCLPSNKSQVTVSFIDAPAGKDRLSITLLLFSSLGLVRRGEQCNLLYSIVLYGPKMAPSLISLSRY